jgi:hypothetical protein
VAKKKKPPCKKKPSNSSFTTFKQDFSFDTDFITYLAALGYLIQDEIKQTALEMSGENKMCIPLSTLIKAIKKVGLGEWLKKMPTESAHVAMYNMDENPE